MKAIHPAGRPVRPVFAIFCVAVIAAIVTVQLFAAPAVAEARLQCGPAKLVLETLDTQFGEKVLFIGTGQNNQSIVVTAKPDGSTWTALVDGPDGNYCVMAAGSPWDAAAVVPAGELN